MNKDLLKKSALEQFTKGNCAQATGISLLKAFDLPSDEIQNAMFGFGGGIHMLGNTCGAVVGTLSALGIISQSLGLDSETRMNLFDEFIIEAQKEHPSFFCRDIVGGEAKVLFAKMKKGELEEAEMAEFAKKCNKIVGNMPVIALGILEQYK
jgi:C_GCAxxG_C_C family probable redox protein